MFRQHWREPAFWRWWWGNQAPQGAKASLAGLALLGFLGIGFLAAVTLSEADTARGGASGLAFETTVDKLVTVRDRGRVVVRRVPVVRRVVYRPQTAVQTLFGTRVVTARGRPVVQKRLVTIDGRTRTIIATQTQTNTNTQTQTVARTRTQTQVQTQTSVVTDLQTVVRTETLPVTVQQTVVQTLPPATVTVTVPITVTITLPKP
jgi:hypothetical protein